MLSGTYTTLSFPFYNHMTFIILIFKGQLLNIQHSINLKKGKNEAEKSWCQFSSVTQSCLTLCDLWTAACQASLSITNSQSLLKLISIESVPGESDFFQRAFLEILPGNLHLYFIGQSYVTWLSLPARRLWNVLFSLRALLSWTKLEFCCLGRKQYGYCTGTSGTCHSQ